MNFSIKIDSMRWEQTCLRNLESKLIIRLTGTKLLLRGLQPNVNVTWWAEEVQGSPSSCIRGKHRAETIHVLDAGSAADQYPEFRFP